jgi:hypothetical protein
VADVDMVDTVEVMEEADSVVDLEAERDMVDTVMVEREVSVVADLEVDSEVERDTVEVDSVDSEVERDSVEVDSVDSEVERDTVDLDSVVDLAVERDSEVDLDLEVDMGVMEFIKVFIMLDTYSNSTFTHFEKVYQIIKLKYNIFIVNEREKECAKGEIKENLVLFVQIFRTSAISMKSMQ